jgi:hypothetical protein
MREGQVLYRRGIDMCPCCNTAVYHSKRCALGAAEREIDRLTLYGIKLSDRISDVEGIRVTISRTAVLRTSHEEIAKAIVAYLKRDE